MLSPCCRWGLILPREENKQKKKKKKGENNLGAQALVAGSPTAGGLGPDLLSTALSSSTRSLLLNQGLRGASVG